MIVTLYVTRDCNLSCSYCYAGRKRPERMSRDLARRAVALAMDNSRLTFGVRFFGGEPLLEWDLVQATTLQTLSAARSRQLLPTFSLSTNGMLLEECHIRFFEEHDFSVGISIDGPERTHDRNRIDHHTEGSFRRVQDAFRMIRDRDVRLSVEIVADPSTVADFANSIRFLVEELRVSFIIVSINIFADWHADHVDALNAQYREIAEFYLQRFGMRRPFEIDVINNKMNVILRGGYDPRLVCHLGETEITVVPDGRIYPCLRLVGVDEEGQTVIGTVDAGIDSRKATSMCTQSKLRPSRCRGCANQGLCVNWCASSNLVLGGCLSEVGHFLCHYEQMVINLCRDLLRRIDLEEYHRLYDRYLVAHCGGRQAVRGP